MKFFYTLILISLSINAEPIRVEKSGIEKFSCTYKNLDYFSRGNINPDRVIYSQPLMNGITDKAGELYNYLTERVSDYHFFSEPSGHYPGYSFEKSFFEYQDAKVTIYRSLHVDEKKVIGFCFEGDFSNSLVENFFNKKVISEIKMDGNGEFYLIDDANGVVKFVKENNSITRIYIYTDYD